MSGEQNISDRLLALRAKHALTQTEFAAALGVSLSYIHQLESGKRTEPSDLFVSVLDKWEQLEELKSRDDMRMREDAPSVPPGAIPFPVDSRLLSRVRDIARQSGLAEQTIINAAVEAFVAQCENNRTVHIPLSAKAPEASKKHGRAG